MWNKNKSVALTHFLVRLFYFILAAAVILSVIQSCRISNVFEKSVVNYYAPFYISVPFGFAALVCLDKLLINIKKSIVFHEKNVKFLRIFSWLCLAVSAITLVSAGIIAFLGYYYQQTAAENVVYFPFGEYLYAVILFVVAVAEFFVGLVVRVVKNIFEKAMEIKEENELTI